MNFGLVAFEMLCEMYREELDFAGSPGWPAEPSVTREADIAEAVLRNNIFGIDLDPVALGLARTSLQLKSGVDLPEEQWNLWRGDSLFDENFARRCEGNFDVVVTNPPYVSARNLPAARIASMKKRFRSAWRDLYACFIERSIDFARQGGRVGLLTMQSFMFTGSYERLRGRISERTVIETLRISVPAFFAIGNPGTLQTVAFTASEGRRPGNARRPSGLVAFRLVDIPADRKEAELRNVVSTARTAAPAGRYRFRVQQSKRLRELPAASRGAYWVDAPIRRAFASAFPGWAIFAAAAAGVGDHRQFPFQCCYWWEVESTRHDAPAQATAGRWSPYVKGGQFRRWYEAPRHRVNWEHDGREIKQAIVDRYPYLKGQWKWVAKNTSYYGRGGVTWSYLTSGRFSARRLEAGAIFDVAGSSLFPADIPAMLALLNSSAVHRLLATINPTVNFQVGDLAELPIPPAIPAELGALAESAIRLQQTLDTFDEIAPGLHRPDALA